MESNPYAKYKYKAKLKSIQNNFLNITALLFLMGLEFAMGSVCNICELMPECCVVQKTQT